MRERAAIAAEIALRVVFWRRRNGGPPISSGKRAASVRNSTAKASRSARSWSQGILFRACQPVRCGAEGKGDCILTATLAGRMKRNPVDDGPGYRTGGSADPPICEGPNGMEGPQPRRGVRMVPITIVPAVRWWWTHRLVSRHVLLNPVRAGHTHADLDGSGVTE